MSTPALEVTAVGAQALVQDLGRPGHAGVGVTRAGAADRAALRLVNRLLANTEDAAGLEVLLGGLQLAVRGDVTVAAAGAAARVLLDGRPLGAGAPVRLGAPSLLRVDVPPTGLRTYLGVRGGLAVEPVLGSRSTDTLAGLGPPPLAVGDRLMIGPPPADQPVVDVAPVAEPPGDAVLLRAVPGPRDAYVDGGAQALAGRVWTVSQRADRVGVRLDGERLRRAPTHEGREVPSEGLLRGAVQVPPGGQPVLLLADHPVSGGYPVLAVVVDADCDRAAQLRPGQAVRFRLVPRPSL